MFENHPTLRHILGRAAWYVVTFLVAVTINFFLPRLGDASPIDVLMARATAGSSVDLRTARDREEAYLKEFGLVEVDSSGQIRRDPAGKPVRTTLIRQFTSYLGMSLRGDLGTSILQHPKRVSEIIANALPWTIALQLPTIGLGWVIGNLLGALAAYRRGVFDKVLYPLALLANAVPAFCFGILLVYLFGIQLEWFPAVGGYDEGLTPSLSWDFFSSASYYYVLPFSSVFLIWVGGQAIGMRSMCIYELGTDYVKYAKLLGISERRILLYMFRNAMLPQLTGLALALGAMVGGALVTEMVFSYPGLGMAVLTAIQSNDYPVITGCTLLVTVCVLIANFSVDVLVGFLDPRIRAAQTGGK
ncbi:MAG TPA: ABC transporter permease [Polyangiaceae bacterium]|nr:ABC transporter permease [Polyangiaceae bacterium]